MAAKKSAKKGKAESDPSASGTKLLTPRLAFALAKDGLLVSYRASAIPQTLVVDSLGTGIVLQSWPVIAMGSWVGRMNEGLGGGAEFSASATRVSIASGPLVTSPDEETMGPRWTWKLEVTALSPLALRSLVDVLATPSAQVDTKTLRLEGSLSPDDSALSVDSDRMRAWLADRTAYLGRPKELPFAVEERHVSRGASLRVTFETRLDATKLKTFWGLLSDWGLGVSRYPNNAGSAPGTGDLDYRKLVQEDRDVVLPMSKRDYACKPATDLLLCVLAFAHETIAPIEKAEIAL